MRAHPHLAALAALILSACGASPTIDAVDLDPIVESSDSARDTDPNLARPIASDDDVQRAGGIP